MKKISILSCITFLLAWNAVAQSKSSIGITFGAAIPTGAFAKADAGAYGDWNNTAGFAKTGFGVNVEGVYSFASHWGIAGTLAFSDHGKFSSSDGKKLGDSYTDAFDVDYSTVTTSGRYRTLTFLVGPQYSIAAGKVVFDIRALGGLLKSFSSPQVTVALEDQTDATFTQKSSTASAFGWQVGAGIRYPFNDLISLLVKADYFSSPGVKVDNENRNNSSGRLVTNQPMNWVNVSAGVAFTFGKK